MLASRPVHAFVITPMHNCANYIDRHLTSVDVQHLYCSRYTQVVVDDCSSDETWDIVSGWELTHSAHVRLQTADHGASSLKSFLHGVGYVRAHLAPEPTDVVFWLDGDDWLCDPKAFHKFLCVYDRDPNVEMCYSDHVVWGQDRRSGTGYSGPLPPRDQVRQAPVAFSHLRSFRFRMLDTVDEWRLRDPAHGGFWRFAGDSALFLPMLEVSDSTVYIQEPLMVYNENRPDNDWKKDWDEQQRCSRLIRLQPINRYTPVLPNRETDGDK